MTPDICAICGEPAFPHCKSNRYNANFCTIDCRRLYEGRRDKFKTRRRILRWLAKLNGGILESSVGNDDLKLLQDMRGLKVVSREQGMKGPYWCLTEAGKRQASLHLVTDPPRHP